MAPRLVESEGHYSEIVRSAQEGRIVAVYFYDEMAPPCWEITEVFTMASENPAYTGRVDFYLFNTSLPELETVMSKMRIGFVPLFAFYKGRECFREVLNGAEQAAEVIMRHCA